MLLLSNARDHWITSLIFERGSLAMVHVGMSNLLCGITKHKHTPAHQCPSRSSGG